jgi:sporulation protein YlmC with PRC-barrel domain
MRTATSIKDEPIVDVSNGTRLGTVDRLIISPDSQQLLGLVAKSGGGRWMSRDDRDIRPFPLAGVVCNGCTTKEQPARRVDLFRTLRG